MMLAIDESRPVPTAGMNATTFVEAISVYHKVADGSHPRRGHGRLRRAMLTNDCNQADFRNFFGSITQTDWATG
jgi:hypothetical protein